MLYKQIIVIRADLNMTIGKMVVQGAHVSGDASDFAKTLNPTTWSAWKAEGQKKVVCKANSLEELNMLEVVALNLGLPAASIRDFGLTELQPGTKTALAIGPAKNEDIDPVTKHLKLL